MSAVVSTLAIVGSKNKRTREQSTTLPTTRSLSVFPRLLFHVIHESSGNHSNFQSKSISKAGLRRDCTPYSNPLFNTHTQKIYTFPRKRPFIMADASLRNTFLDPEFTGAIPQPQLTHIISQSLHPGKFHLSCAGSHTIAQLFSQFMNHGGHIIQTLLCETPTLSQGPTLVAYFPEPKASVAMLTDTERQLTRTRLGQLLQGLDFIVAPMASEGLCTRQSNERSSMFPGCASTITISQRNIDRVNNATSNRNNMEYQYWMYHIASTFWHELGHAMAYVALPIAYAGEMLPRQWTDH